jgi:FkbM family methyltransferase
MIELVENREGWYWPIADTNTFTYLKKHSTLPRDISELVTHKSVVIQAGGNCGMYPKQYASLFDTVYTFEPDWLNFYCLTLNVPEPNVIKTQACLGNESKLVGLGVKDWSRGKTFVKGHGKCPVYLIDNIGLEECSLIHLDIEGYEYFALLGATKTILKFKPIIVIEMWEEEKIDRFNVSNNTTEDLIFSLGYTYLKTLNGSDRIYIPNINVHLTN